MSSVKLIFSLLFQRPRFYSKLMRSRLLGRDSDRANHTGLERTWRFSLRTRRPLLYSQLVSFAPSRDYGRSHSYQINANLDSLFCWKTKEIIEKCSGMIDININIHIFRVLWCHQASVLIKLLAWAFFGCTAYRYCLLSSWNCLSRPLHALNWANKADNIPWTMRQKSQCIDREKIISISYWNAGNLTLVAS